MKLYCVISAFSILLSGCNASMPMKEMSAADTKKLFNEMSGTYQVTDSRNNKHTKISSIDFALAEQRGNIQLTSENGSVRTLNLWKCELPNKAQMENFGAPASSVEELIRCTMLSNYKYAAVYIGKVKNDYVMSDGAMLKSYEPMTITSGYVIDIREDIGKGIILNARKD